MNANVTELEMMVNQLNELKTEENKQVVVNYLADLFKEMGYTAIGEEIRNNRKAKDNALYGLKMYRSNLIGDRINPITNEVYKASQSKIDKANAFYSMMETLINNYLDNGSDKQNEYLKLKQEHDNASYLFHEAMFKLDVYMDNASSRSAETMEEYKQLRNEYKRLDTLSKEAKNKLDQFVLSNLI